MKTGVVIGEVWATRKSSKLEGVKLQLVRSGESLLVVRDELDAGVGDHVAVSFGSGARNAIMPGANRHILCDAAITRIIEGEEPS